MCIPGRGRVGAQARPLRAPRSRTFSLWDKLAEGPREFLNVWYDRRESPGPNLSRRTGVFPSQCFPWLCRKGQKN